MAHVERHHRKPCARDGCAHGFTRHGKSTKGACTVNGCGCTRWRADEDDRETWRARWRDPAGAEHAKTFARKLDADRYLAGVEHAKLKGAYIDPKLGRTRFGELAERWHNTTAGLKPSTRHAYRVLLDLHVLPSFRDAPVAHVDRLAVSEWLAALLAGGMSAARARDAFQVLSLVFAAGVDGGLLVASPASGVRLPKLTPTEMCFLDPGEVERLAAAIEPRYRVLVNTAAYSGARFGELVALRVGRLDLLRGTCEIAESATEVKGRLEWGATKTNERRTVRLPRFLCSELGAHLAGQPHERTELVFAAPKGGPLRHSDFIKRKFRPAVTAAGLDPRLRFHDLRHTCASLLIREGASVKAVQKTLGHKSATVTLDRYGHLFPDELESAADRLDRARTHALADPGRTRQVPPVAQLAGRAR